MPSSRPGPDALATRRTSGNWKRKSPRLKRKREDNAMNDKTRHTPENTPAPDPKKAVTVDPVAPLIDPTDVPNMSDEDIDNATGGGLQDDASTQQGNAAQGLQEARDKAQHKDEDEDKA